MRNEGETAALARCDSYEEEKVQAALDRAVGFLGGYDAFFRPGMRVVIKPNLMRKSDPALCAVVHPSVIRAVAKRAAERGAHVLLAESPGGVYNPAALRGIYEAAGLLPVAEETGMELNYDTSDREVPVPGRRLKSLHVISPLLEADLVVNIAKMKSHTLAVYSGAVKNLYGVIPGLLKAEMHFQHQSVESFSDMVVDICDFIKPQLNIVDAVMAMEGEGPGSGDPREVDALVASPSAYAADAVSAGLAGYAIDELPMLRLARERGLFSGEVEILGDDPESLRVKDFVRASQRGNHLLQSKVPGFLVKPLESWFALKPKVRRKACVGCGICALDLPGQNHRDPGPQGKDSPQGVYPVLLLPGILPQKGHCRQAELVVPGGDPGDGRAEEIADFPFCA